MSRSRYDDKMRSAWRRNAKGVGIRIKGRPEVWDLDTEEGLAEARVGVVIPQDVPVGMLEHYVALPNWECELLGVPYGSLQRVETCPPITEDMDEDHLRDCAECAHQWAMWYHEEPDWDSQEEPTEDPREYDAWRDNVDVWRDGTGLDYVTGRDAAASGALRSDDWMPVMTYREAVQELGEGFIVEGGPRTHVGTTGAYMRAWEAARYFGVEYRLLLRYLHAVGETAVTHPFHQVALPALERVDNL